MSCSGFCQMRTECDNVLSVQMCLNVQSRVFDEVYTHPTMHYTDTHRLTQTICICIYIDVYMCVCACVYECVHMYMKCTESFQQSYKTISDFHEVIKASSINHVENVGL
jgi:hypothetical protein